MHVERVSIQASLLSFFYLTTTSKLVRVVDVSESFSLCNKQLPSQMNCSVRKYRGRKILGDARRMSVIKRSDSFGEGRGKHGGLEKERKLLQKREGGVGCLWIKPLRTARKCDI